MRRVALALIVALFAVPVGTVSASAAPIDVNANPGEGVVTVTATVLGTYSETIKTGKLAVNEDPTNPDNGPGLCATGDIHESCTPANEASGR